MKVGSLFSGCGGFDLGLMWAGMETVWFVEKDPYAQYILSKHWPNKPIYGDIKTINFKNMDWVDLLVGGFPCQPYSSANRTKWKCNDEKHLWPEFKRAISDLKPTWILGENVRNLLYLRKGSEFGAILRDLSSLGYDAEWQLLPSGFKYRHFRWRLFFLGYPKSFGLVQNEIFAGASNERHFRGWAEFNSSPVFKKVWGMANEDYVRRADGFPYFMDSIRLCGNAVVPHTAEWIGRKIIERHQDLIGDG